MTPEQILFHLLTTTRQPMTEEAARAAIASIPRQALDFAMRDKDSAIDMTRYVKAGMPVQQAP